jgi:hypothetical protein
VTIKNLRVANLRKTREIAERQAGCGRLEVWGSVQGEEAVMALREQDGCCQQLR